MKFCIAIACLLISVTTVSAQRKTDVYAYSRNLSPGVPNQTIEFGSGKMTDNTKSKTNYYIFLATGVEDSLFVKQLWLKKKGYKVELVTVGDRPLKEGSVELVPATKRQIWRLYPNDTLPESTEISRKLQRCIDKFPCVVVYNYNGKERYQEASAIIMLEAEPAQ